MKSLRHYINLVEQSEDDYVYHGGSYAGGEYNPSKVGEPGNIRPLGVGIYAAKTPEHAQLYVKYAGSNGAVKKFKVSKTAKLYPWGADAWSKLTPAEAAQWRAKSAEIQTAFEKANLVKFNTFRKQYNHWQDAVSGFGAFDKEQMRKILVSVGVDGAKQILSDDMTELVFYNTSVLTPV